MEREKHTENERGVGGALRGVVSTKVKSAKMNVPDIHDLVVNKRRPKEVRYLSRETGSSKSNYTSRICICIC